MYSNVFTQSGVSRRSSILAKLWSSQVSGKFSILSHHNQHNTIKIESSIEKHDILQHLIHKKCRAHNPYGIDTCKSLHWLYKYGRLCSPERTEIEYKLQLHSGHISASDLVTCSQVVVALAKPCTMSTYKLIVRRANPHNSTPNDKRS